MRLLKDVSWMAILVVAILAASFVFVVLPAFGMSADDVAAVFAAQGNDRPDAVKPSKRQLAQAWVARKLNKLFHSKGNDSPSERGSH